MEIKAFEADKNQKESILAEITKIFATVDL